MYRILPLILFTLLLTASAPAASYSAWLPSVTKQPIIEAVLVYGSPPGAQWQPGEHERLHQQAAAALAFWERWGPDHQARPIVAVFEVATAAAPQWGNGGLTWADAYVRPGRAVLAVVQVRDAPGWFFTRSYAYCDRARNIWYIRSSIDGLWDNTEIWPSAAWAHEGGHCLYNLKDMHHVCPEDDIMGYAEKAWERGRPGRCSETLLAGGTL